MARIMPTDLAKEIEGSLRVSAKGLGYLNWPSLKPKYTIEIEPMSLNTALNGDQVRVRVIGPVAGKTDLYAGEVIEIRERKKLEFVGVIEQENGFIYLIPDDKRFYRDILIDGKLLNGAQAGQKVLAKIIKWEDAKKEPQGEVVQIIGQPGEHNTEMLAVVFDRGFKTGFPDPVEAEAKKLKDFEPENLKREVESGRRLDFRQVPTFTIDPVDAKDFDDAISIREVGNGRWEVGVHIADVSHYVRPGTALDAEAIKRATSIYLVDRTIPMLPEILSNDLCSLVADQDRLVFSAIFSINDDGEVLERKFGKAIIHSQKRFSYEEAQTVLTKGEGQFAAELTTLNKLAYRLREKKIADGAIVFETEEIKFELDESGKPIRAYKKIRTDTHLLVEDFMLLANREVAQYVAKLTGEGDKKFVYRVHDLPDHDKLKQLSDFIRPLGYHLKLTDGQISSRDLNLFLQMITGKPEEMMIKTAAMRSMAKAIYSTKNIGHYGLAFTYYTHFTSPIRRYPDLMVHRLLEIYLQSKLPPGEMLAEYNHLVEHTSEREVQAQEAERDSIRYKQVEFMSARVGQTFDGVISGIAKWGLYVQDQETGAEGLIRISNIGDDFYVFDEKSYAIVGERKKERYRLGDKIKVKIVSTNLADRQIDLTIVK